MFPSRISSLGDFSWSGEERFSNCHSKECLVMPPAIRSVSYAPPVKEIDFIGKKKKAGKGINDSAGSSRKRKTFDIPTLEEKKF